MDDTTGIVVMAQESRFRLIDDRGRAHLFLLAHDAPLEPDDLQALQRAQARVVVRWTQPSDLIAGVAHDLTVLSSPQIRLAGDAL